MGGFYTISFLNFWTAFDGLQRTMQLLQVALYSSFLSAPLKSFINSLATNFTANHALGTLHVLVTKLKPWSV